MMLGQWHCCRCDADMTYPAIHFEVILPYKEAHDVGCKYGEEDAKAGYRCI